MDLKELLGEELYNQVIEKAGDNKLAVVSDGNWFPKDKFDAKNREVKDLQGQLLDRDDQLAELKKVDPEAMQQTIEDLQESNKNKDTEYQKKLEEQAKNFAIESALRDAKAKNPKLAKGALDVDSISFKDGKLTGFDEQLTAVKESDAYLFGEDGPPGLKGRQPHEGGTGTQGINNPFSKDHFNLTEQGRLLKDDPELYKQLKTQA